MKKTVSAILIVVYVIMSCGIMINQHYCMNRFQSFDLFTTGNEDCNQCGMTMKDQAGCCKDEIKIVKLQDDQNVSAVTFSIKKVEVPAQILPDFIAVSFNISAKPLQQVYEVPPDLSDQDAYLQNCVFRI